MGLSVSNQTHENYPEPRIHERLESLNLVWSSLIADSVDSFYINWMMNSALWQSFHFSIIVRIWNIHKM